MPPYEKMIRGNYENSIRRHSSVEKIYEVFSNEVRKGGVFMSYHDQLKAITPFNYSLKDDEEIANWVKENPPANLIRLVDIDQSGDISVVEYCLFFTFHELSIPAIKKHFSDEGDHSIDRELTKHDVGKFFKQRANAIQFGIVETMQPDGRTGKVNKELYRKALDDFVNRMFNDKEKMTVQDLVNIKSEIRKEVYAFEFNNFEVIKGEISAGDFAKCIASYMPKKFAQKWIKDADFTKEKNRIDFTEFCSFKNFFTDNFKDFDDVFQNQGIMTRKRFMNKITEQTEQYGNPMSIYQKNLLFDLIDQNGRHFLLYIKKGNGKIDVNEFMSVLKNLRHLGRNFYDRVNFFCIYKKG